MSELVGGAALVTGGGSGIGRAIAVALAEGGAPVAVLDLRPEGGEQTVARIAETGGRATFLRADVSRWEDVDRAFADAVGAVGPLGIVVNAAGILDGYSPAEETAPSLWEQVIGINLTGTFFCCRRGLTELPSGGPGRIVNIASAAGLIGDGGGAAYVASKHGVVGLTRQLAVDQAGRGITINAICPGPIQTELRDHSATILGPDAPPMSGVGIGADEAKLRAVVPVGRWGTVQEIATAVSFLASEAAGYITGHTLVIDGGWTAR